MKTSKILFTSLIISFFWSCSQPQKTLYLQEQIKTDYDHIQSQITEIESEL